MIPHHGVSRRAVLTAAAAVPSAAFLAGCSGEASPEPVASGEPVRARMLTGLRLQAWEAYLFVGLDKGWFAEEGLELEILSGDGTGRNLEFLQGGQAEFATLDVNAALIEYAKATTGPGDDGGFDGFRLTSVLHANLLSCIMTKQDSGMRRVRDLSGTSLAVIPGGTNTVVFPAFAELNDLDPASVELVQIPPPSFIPALANDQVGSIMQFVINRVTVEADAGPVVVWPYADDLPELYGSGIGCSRQMADQQPDLVRRFNRAALRSLEHTVANPDEAGAIMAQSEQVNLPAEVIAASTRDLAPYVRAENGQQLGQFNEDRMVQTVALLTQLGAMEHIDFQDVVVPADLLG